MSDLSRVGSRSRPDLPPVHHGELFPGDTFTWNGHFLKVEPGSVALGMPIRELTLHVSEPHSPLPPDD